MVRCQRTLSIQEKHLALPQPSKIRNIRLHPGRKIGRKIPAVKRSIKPFVLLTAFAALAACSSNPITGRNQFLMVSEESAIGSSASAYAGMIGGLEKKKQIEAGTPRAQKVQEITDKLIAQAVRFRPDSASWKWEVKVIDDPKTVNAFCMAGGKMAIYSGFWEKLKATDDEVAAVMGHEIGHALASHTRERMSVAMGTGLLTTIGAIAISRDGRNQEMASVGLTTAAALAVTLPNSREGELEADQIGIELAARAGYDPRAAVTLWEKMGKLGGNPPEFLSTHPSPENRAARLKELASKVDPLYQAAKAGKPLDAPKFLATPGAGANERVVSRPGEPTREEYAARSAKEADTLLFLSEPFERFKSGKAIFDCQSQCGFSYASKKGDWKRLHERQSWRDLAVSVMQVGYLSDLSYFMLAEAARGLGLQEPASVYYKRALEAGKDHGCGSGFFSCEGFDVQKLSAVAVRRP
jgi:Zn-dependent protease with chaperone function